jgi:hypothetical protein
LNLGGPVLWKPAGPFVAFVAADIAQVSSEDPPSWTPERDFGFWVPVVGGQMKGPRYVPDRAAFFIPYLWVDNILAVVAGREVQGFPKGLGNLQMPMAAEDPAQFTIDAMAVVRYGKPGDPASRWSPHRIVTVERKDALRRGEIKTGWTTLEGILQMLALQGTSILGGGAISIPGLPLFRAFLESMTTKTVPMVFLKELPDVSDTHKAAYQAVVEVPNQVVGGLRSGGMLAGRYEMRIERYDSCHIVDRLGLVTQGNILRPAFQFSLCFDFVHGRGRVLHQTTPSAGANAP